MLINKSLAGQKVATEFGDIQFNENGETKDLKTEQAEKLAKLPGFELKAAPKAAPKKEAPAAEEKKAPAKKASTAKK
jgi:hypothetical protein